MYTHEDGVCAFTEGDPNPDPCEVPHGKAV